MAKSTMCKSGSGILRSAASLTSEALMGRGGVGFNPARNCDAIIRDVRRRTARERVRIMDLFKDFDRHQHGRRGRGGGRVCCWYSTADEGLFVVASFFLGSTRSGVGRPPVLLDMMG